MNQGPACRSSDFTRGSQFWNRGTSAHRSRTAKYVHSMAAAASCAVTFRMGSSVWRAPSSSPLMTTIFITTSAKDSRTKSLRTDSAVLSVAETTTMMDRAASQRYVYSA